MRCVYLRQLKLIRIGIGYLRTGSFISEIVFGTGLLNSN